MQVLGRLHEAELKPLRGRLLEIRDGDAEVKRANCENSKQYAAEVVTLMNC